MRRDTVSNLTEGCVDEKKSIMLIKDKLTQDRTEQRWGKDEF